MNPDQHVPAWRKASRSSGTGNDCVELARLGGAVGVRDSKNPGGGHIALRPAAARALAAAVKAGRHDL